MRKRKKPEVMQHDHAALRKKEVVLHAAGVWAVVHERKPISIVIEKADGKSWRYPKTVFTSPAFALNLARRLNSIFATDKFSVIELQAQADT